jgi:hypothetical protein
MDETIKPLNERWLGRFKKIDSFYPGYDINRRLSNVAFNNTYQTYCKLNFHLN